jgi:hypothetical protein
MMRGAKLLIVPTTNSMDTDKKRTENNKFFQNIIKQESL